MAQWTPMTARSRDDDTPARLRAVGTRASASRSAPRADADGRLGSGSRPAIPDEGTSGINFASVSATSLTLVQRNNLAGLIDAPVASANAALSTAKWSELMPSV